MNPLYLVGGVIAALGMLAATLNCRESPGGGIASWTGTR